MTKGYRSYIIPAVALLLAGYTSAVLHADPSRKEGALIGDVDWQYSLEIRVFNQAGDTIRTATVTAVDIRSGRSVALIFDTARAMYYRTNFDHRRLNITVSAPGYETQSRKVLLRDRERVGIVLGRPGDRYFYGIRGLTPYMPDTMMVGFKMRDTSFDHREEYPPEEREKALIRFLQWKSELWKERVQEIASEAEVEPEDIELLGPVSPWGKVKLSHASMRHDVLRALRENPLIEYAGPLVSREPFWPLGHEPYLSIMPNLIAVELERQPDPQGTLDSIAEETGARLVHGNPEYSTYYFVTDPSVAEDISDILALIVRRESVWWAYIQMPLVITW